MRPAREQLTLNRAPNSEGSEEVAYVSAGSDTTLQTMTKKESQRMVKFIQGRKRNGAETWAEIPISPLSLSLPCFCGLPGISSPMEGGYRFALRVMRTQSSLAAWGRERV